MEKTWGGTIKRVRLAKAKECKGKKWEVRWREDMKRDGKAKRWKGKRWEEKQEDNKVMRERKKRQVEKKRKRKRNESMTGKIKRIKKWREGEVKCHSINGFHSTGGSPWDALPQRRSEGREHRWQVSLVLDLATQLLAMEWQNCDV